MKPKVVLRMRYSMFRCQNRQGKEPERHAGLANRLRSSSGSSSGSSCRMHHLATTSEARDTPERRSRRHFPYWTWALTRRASGCSWRHTINRNMHHIEERTATRMPVEHATGVCGRTAEPTSRPRAEDPLARAQVFFMAPPSCGKQSHLHKNSTIQLCLLWEDRC